MVGAIREVADIDFKEVVLTSTRPVLVDCWAEWCKPCVGMMPALESIAERYAEALTVAKIDVDKNAATAGEYGVRNLPTLILIKDGAVLGRRMGALTAGQLASWVDEQLKLG